MQQVEGLKSEGEGPPSGWEGVAGVLQEVEGSLNAEVEAGMELEHADQGAEAGERQGLGGSAR